MKLSQVTEAIGVKPNLDLRWERIKRWQIELQGEIKELAGEMKIDLGEVFTGRETPILLNLKNSIKLRFVSMKSYRHAIV